MEYVQVLLYTGIVIFKDHHLSTKALPVAYQMLSIDCWCEYLDTAQRLLDEFLSEFKNFYVEMNLRLTIIIQKRRFYYCLFLFIFY